MPMYRPITECYWPCISEHPGGRQCSPVERANCQIYCQIYRPDLSKPMDPVPRPSSVPNTLPPPFTNQTKEKT